MSHNQEVLTNSDKLYSFKHLNIVRHVLICTKCVNYMLFKNFIFCTILVSDFNQVTNLQYLQTSLSIY